VSRPTLAAPKACTTSSVRMTASSPMLGASRIPDTAAKADPSIHEKVVIRRLSEPTSSVSSPSAMTARVWRPRWVRRKNNPRPTAARAAIITMNAWSTPT